MTKFFLQSSCSTCGYLDKTAKDVDHPDSLKCTWNRYYSIDADLIFTLSCPNYLLNPEHYSSLGGGIEFLTHQPRQEEL